MSNLPPEVVTGLNELDYLFGFNKRVTASIQRAIKDLTDSSFTDLANLLLLRRESYLEHTRLGVKPETVAALRVSPLHLTTLFEEAAVLQAEKEVTDFDSRPPSVQYRSNQGSNRGGCGQSWSNKGKQATDSNKGNDSNKKKYWRQVAKKPAAASKGASDKPDFSKSNK